jgi:acyl carrier protein
MDIFGDIRDSLTEILDIDAADITPETYVIRELDAESIDLLELSVALNARFKVEINDDEIYLKTLRICLSEAEGNGGNAGGHIAGRFPFLSGDRIDEILSDLDGGPVLKVKDLMAYVSWRFGKN